jgi:hypothetical protein
MRTRSSIKEINIMRSDSSGWNIKSELLGKKRNKKNNDQENNTLLNKKIINFDKENKLTKNKEIQIVNGSKIPKNSKYLQNEKNLQIQHNEKNDKIDKVLKNSKKIINSDTNNLNTNLITKYSDFYIDIENAHKANIKYNNSLPANPKLITEIFNDNYVDSLMCTTPNRVESPGSGFKNLGNTCFLNSVLQCILYTVPLKNYFNLSDHSQTCRIKGVCFICEYCSLSKLVRKKYNLNIYL